MAPWGKDDCHELLPSGPRGPFQRASGFTRKSVRLMIIVRNGRERPGGRVLLLALIGMGLIQAASPARAQHWIASWGSAPAPAQHPAADIPQERVTPVFENQTIVQKLRLSRGGTKIRIRFTNEYGRAPLRIGAARLVLDGGPNRPSVERVIRFGGAAAVTVPAGAPMVSDTIELPTPDRATLTIALFLPDRVVDCTCHTVGGDTALVSAAGDYSAQAASLAPASTTGVRAFLSRVDVETKRRTPVMIAFGDSITDGYRSTSDHNRRYPDILAERLAVGAGRRAAVVNAGLSGNRLLSNGPIVATGENALARFDRDVLAVPGVSHVIILEGVNDLGGGGAAPPSAATLIAGYQQLIGRARARGVQVIGATILPYEGARYYRLEGEAVRQEVNQWIRTAGAFDAVADFDLVMREPSRPSRMKAELQSGDWLHPNDAGYRIMAMAVPSGVL